MLRQAILKSRSQPRTFFCVGHGDILMHKLVRGCSVSRLALHFLTSLSFKQISMQCDFSVGAQKLFSVLCYYFFHSGRAELVIIFLSSEACSSKRDRIPVCFFTHSLSHFQAIVYTLFSSSYHAGSLCRSSSGPRVMPVDILGAVQLAVLVATRHVALCSSSQQTLDSFRQSPHHAMG